MTKDTIWYRFADAFANYMGVADTDVGIRLTAGYIACLGENKNKQKKFIIDYDSVKDIELTYFYNYFSNRFKNHTLNCLHILKLEKLIEGRIANEAFVANDGTVWIPVNSYYFEISVFETGTSVKYLDNTQFVDLSKYAATDKFTSEPTTVKLIQLITEKARKIIHKSFDEMCVYEISCSNIFMGVKNFGLRNGIISIVRFFIHLFATIIYYGIEFVILYLSIIEGFINTFIFIHFIARILNSVIGYLRGLLTSIQSLIF